MRHRLEGKKFGREKAHRTSLFRNLVKSMIVSPNGRIETTVTKAKSLRGYVDRLITYAKKDTVASRRLAYSVLGNRTLVKKLFEEVGPQMQERQGGYTRVLKTGYRKGDSAPMAIIEFVKPADQHEEKKADGKKGKTAKKAKPVVENIKAADLVEKPAKESKASKPAVEPVEEVEVSEPVEEQVEEIKAAEPVEEPVEEVTETEIVEAPAEEPAEEITEPEEIEKPSE